MWPWPVHDIGDGVEIAFGPDGCMYWRHPECRAWAWLFFRPHHQSTGHELGAGGAHDVANLTIVGSLGCPKKGCGFHGVIERGRWRSC